MDEREISCNALFASGIRRSIIKLFVNRIVSTNEQHDIWTLNIMSYYAIYDIFLKITRVAHLRMDQRKHKMHTIYKWNYNWTTHIFEAKKIR